MRDYAATLKDPTVNPHPEGAKRLEDEAEAAMKAMGEKFHALGEQVYVDAEKVKESNRAL